MAVAHDYLFKENMAAYGRTYKMEPKQKDLFLKPRVEVNTEVKGKVIISNETLHDAIVGYINTAEQVSREFRLIQIM